MEIGRWDRSYCGVRVFLDYWNYELLIRDEDDGLNSDWAEQSM